ncbi:MAG: hypothetical protein HKN36_07015 [Hellea sp.]|nr:hypothetical protein [Hellea sp.]
MSCDEIYAAARKAGHASLSSIAIMALESNSEVSVIDYNHIGDDYDTVEPLLSKDEFAKFCEDLNRRRNM